MTARFVAPPPDAGRRVDACDGGPCPNCAMLRAAGSIAGAPGVDRMGKTTSNNSDSEKQSAMTRKESKGLQAAQKKGLAILPMLPAPR